MTPLGKMIRYYREAKGLTLKEVGNEMGVAFQSVEKWEKGETRPATGKLTKLAAVLGVSVADLLREDLVSKVSEREEIYSVHGKKFGTAFHDLQYVDLPYTPVSARAHFVEMGGLDEADYHGETYRVPYVPGQNLNGQRVFEIDGDSMEPFYVSGMKVRASLVGNGKWAYLNSGVYVIVYDDFFVVKRIKANNYAEGFFELHSDNQETGGSVKVPVSQIRSMWKVERIVDGPAR